MSRFKLKHWQRRRLRQQLRTARDARTYRRTLAVLELDRGRSAADIADMLGVTRQSVHNWAAAYTLDRDPSALADDERAGRPRLLTEDAEALLRSLLGRSPQDPGHQATSWTVPLLQHELERGTGGRPSDDTVRRGLARLGYAWKRPRYVLAPDPEREKKTADPAANPRPAVPQRGPGPGRDGPPAVPAPEGRMGAAGRASQGVAGRRQRASSGLRRHEPADGDAAAGAAPQGPECRLPGVPRRGPSALPGLARGAAAGRRPQPHGEGLAEGVGRDRAAVAAEAVAGVEPDGHVVGPGQGRHQRRQAVRNDRGSCGPLLRAPEGPVGPGGVAYVGRPLR